MTGLYGLGEGNGYIRARTPGPQVISLYGEGQGYGSIVTTGKTPPAAFDDWAFFGSTEVDPAITYNAESTLGKTVVKGEGWQRHWMIATPPADYPTSDGYAWQRASFAAIGFKLNGMVDGNFVYLEDVQMQVLPLDKTVPTAYETPRRIETVVKPDRLNYSTNPSFEVDAADWTANGRVSVARDTSVFRAGVASGKVTWTTIGPLTDPDYEGGVVPTGVSGYFGGVPGIVSGGANGSANALGITLSSTSNPQGMVHQPAIGVTVPANTVIKAGVWIKATAGQSVKLNGMAYNPTTSSALGEVTGVQVVATGAWQYVTATWTWAAEFRPAIVVRMRDGGGYTIGHTIAIDQPVLAGAVPDNSSLSQTLTNLIAGRRYVASVWVNWNYAPEPTLSVDSGTPVTQRIAEDGAWRRYYVTFTATSSTATFRIQVPTIFTGNNVMWIDQMLVEEGDYPQEYFDGGYGPDYLWEVGGTTGKTRSYHYSQRVYKHAILQRLLAENTPVGIYAMEPQYAVPFTS